MRTRSLLVLLPALAAGCTRNSPPGDFYRLSSVSGGIAVDDRTENAFVSEDHFRPYAVSPTTALVAVDPDTGTLTSVMDMTGRSDPRVVFPKNGVLVMSEVSGHDTLTLFDSRTFAPLRQADATVEQYDGAHMSPSRSWVSVNEVTHSPGTTTIGSTYVIDTGSLQQLTVPNDSDYLRAMWMNQSDRLIALASYDTGTPTAHARILSWDMSQVAAAGYMPDSSGFWPMPGIDLDLPGLRGAFFSAFTWFSVSPDDHWVVFSVLDLTAQRALVVLDTTTGTVRTVAHATGPVFFTPDSATFVASNDMVGTGQGLVVVDANTLAVKPVTVPVESPLSYFVSDDGKDVVVTSINGGPLAVYDLVQGTTTPVGAPYGGPFEMVSRPGTRQVWLVIDDGPWELDLAAGSLTEPVLDGSPQHLTILPKHNRIVFDVAYGEAGEALDYYDPDAKMEARLVTGP
jgi:hypothetical protein